MNKCKYCNRTINNDSEFCSEECSEKAGRYLDKWTRYKLFFNVMVFGCLISIIGQLILFPEYIFISRILIIIMAGTLIILPFGNTVNSMGIKKTTIIIRVVSALLILLSIAAFITDF